MVGRPEIHVFGSGHRGLAERVKRIWPEAVVRDNAPAGACDVAMVWDTDTDPGELIRFMTRQSEGCWLHTTASGVPAELLAIARDRGVVVTKGSGAHGPAVAEHVLALLLAHVKRLPELIRAQRARHWEPLITAELAGQTVGILGLGAVGRSIARLLSAMGVTVLGVRHGQGDVPEVARTYQPAGLAELLGVVDALVIAVPLTPLTRGMIGSAELARLKPGAVIVNVARGPVVVTAALVAALESGHLAGAALDVFDAEPLPASSPLWNMPNVVLTPHCADRTPGTDVRSLQLMLDNVLRFRTGLPLRNVVDLDRGY